MEALRFGVAALALVGAFSHRRRRRLRRYGVPWRRPRRGRRRPKAWLLFTDLAGTRIGGGDGDRALEAFNVYWAEAHAPAGGVLIYNTGRSARSYMDKEDY